MVAVRGFEPRCRGRETDTRSSGVLGIVGFVREIVRIVGPSPLETALFVRKVSSFFQVLANSPEPTNVLDLPRSNPLQCGEYLRDQRHQIGHAIRCGTDHHDAERQSRNVLLMLDVSIHRHEGVRHPAGAL